MSPVAERPLLVLDVDETLIHSPDTVLAERPPDFWVGPHAIYERPGVRAFLRAAATRFELAIWSSADRSYVLGIIERIADGVAFEFIWGVERCTPRRDIEYDELHWLKDVKKVVRRGWDRRRVLMVDDSREKLARNHGNAIYVAPFLGDPEDDELSLLATYLASISEEVDFRRLEKRGWRTRVATR